MAATQGDRINRLQATNPRIVPVAIPATTPISGAAPGTTIGSLATQAAVAQAAADAANTALGNIASDNVLSAGEKSAVILSYNTIIGEQAGIGSQAITFGLSRSAYDATVSALIGYLASLSPGWNDTAHDTPIIGTIFRAKFADVYAARQALLNAISGQAKALADNAQAAANIANSTANQALSYGAAALGGLDGKMGVNASQVVGTNFYLKTAGYDSGNGIALYDGGIIARYGGEYRMTINTASGSFIFKGDISGSTGTFTGDITTTGHVYATGTYTAGGVTAAVVGSSSSGAGVAGYSWYETGVFGLSGYGTGGSFQSFSVGVYASGYPAIQADGDVTITRNGNLTVPRINGIASGNILSYVGVANPANKSAPAGFLQFRTIDGLVAIVPFYS